MNLLNFIKQRILLGRKSPPQKKRRLKEVLLQLVK